MVSKGFNLWRKIKVRDAFQITQKPSRFSWKEDKNIPFIPMANIREEGLQVLNFELRAAKEISSATYFERGDFLLSKITPCFENLKQGFCDSLPKEYGFTSTEIIPIKGIENIGASKFLSHYLLRSGVRNELAQKMVGTTGRQRLTKECLLNYELLLPSFEEQKAIAKVLCTIQEAMEICNKELKLQQELKDALMMHLFTSGTKNEQLKETEIGPIPESWEIVSLENLCSLRKESIQPLRVDGKTPYVGLEHIDSRNPILCRYGNAEEVKSSKNKFFRQDVLFGKLRPYLQKAVLSEMEGICSTDILVFSHNNSTDPFFLTYLIHSTRFMEFAKQTTSGTNHPRTSWASLKKLKVAKPSYSEQLKIGEILQHSDRRIQSINKELLIYKELFQSMLEELMTGRISTLPLIEKAELAL